MFLQNLSGKDSLIGKSITLMQVVPDGDNIAVDCCVIGEDELPSHMEDLSVKDNKETYKKITAPDLTSRSNASTSRSRNLSRQWPQRPLKKTNTYSPGNEYPELKYLSDIQPVWQEDLSRSALL